uniref:Uncharacterized protein n=1 Tax=Heterorhabditis bacteriophora TaxID=37862 RepID=A0A1I7X582_HETBA
MPCSLEFPNMDDFDFGKINKLNMGTTRAHLCDQTKVVIGRVLAYNREMSRRLGVFKRHTPFISPERLTAQQTGFSLTTIRNCSEDRLVVGKCTDRPNTKSAEEVRREQRREELADIFADETWCELPKSYRKDVNEFEKQNVRRSQRVRKLRSGLKRRWADTTEGETTILDDSIGSHDFQSSQQK